MTQQEFNAMEWRTRSRVVYRGSIYEIAAVNFYEKLFGIVFGEADGDDSEDDLIWVRCESVELVK